MFVGWGIGIFGIALLAIIPAIFLKENKRINTPNKPDKIGLFKSIKQILKHKNMRILMGIMCAQIFFGALSASMDSYVLVYHMFEGDIKLGTTWKGVLSTSYAVFGIIAIALWTYLSSKIGKVATFKIVCWLTCFGGLAKWFIYNPGNEYWLILDAALCTNMWVSIGVLIASMLADMIDKDELEHAERREGLFVSLKAWAVKCAGSIAVILAGLLLNLIGFDALLAGDQSTQTIILMKSILCIGTILGAAISLLLINHYDLTKEELIQIQSLLKQGKAES